MRQTSSLAVELDSDVVMQDCNPFAAPTELSGRAVLRLAEATAIDDITVTFSGVASSRAHWTDCPASFHIICEHTVTLFKRDVRQPASRHYFCPGHHDFAFSICLGDSLPASTSTTSADVHYELSAYAAFQGPSKNSGLRKKAPVTLIRSLPSDSLLFQQSLDVESSRDLVHATVSMPHQAWAAGETLACSLQTLTLDKGLQCTNMKLSIVQTEHIHEVIGQDDRSRVLSRIQHDLRTKTPRPSLALIQRRLGIDRPCHRSQNQTPGQRSSVMLSIPIPPNTQSSQSIAPIIISHRLECALTAVDGGGRLSEIIFSLPLHILDARLRIHVASATHYARAAFHGFCGVSEDFLPSYHAHVQDRVPSCSNLREGCTSNTPTYEASAMHFIGGLPPLDSLRELPRYSATS